MHAFLAGNYLNIEALFPAFSRKFLAVAARLARGRLPKNADEGTVRSTQDEERWNTRKCVGGEGDIAG